MKSVINLFLLITVLSFFGCKKKDKDKSYTATIDGPTILGAKATFSVTKNGGNIDPSEYGIVCNKLGGATVNDIKVVANSNQSSLTFKHLDLSKMYFARGYVIDKDGTHYSNEISFETHCIDLDSIYPKSAPVGATVTVYGRGFSSVAINDILVERYDKTSQTTTSVYPTAVTSTTLTFTVPNNFVVGRSYEIGVTKYQTCNYGYENHLNGVGSDPSILLTVSN